MKTRLIATCPVCGEQSARIAFADELGDVPPTVDYNFSPETRRTLQIVECVGCKHQFVHPLPRLDNLYEENVDPVYLKSEPQRRKSARDWTAIVNYYYELYFPKSDGRTLLDIGCATGVFLDAASSCFTVEGIELSRWAADLAATRHRVHRMQLSQLGLSRNFDVATLWGVIEHLQSPGTELRAIHQNLMDSGLLFVYTGNRLAWLPRLLGKRWWWYQGMHIQYFSRSTLTRLLNSCGFSVVGERRLPIYFSLASLGQSLNRYQILKPIVWLLQSIPASNLLIKLSLSGEMLIVARKVVGEKKVGITQNYP